MRTRTLRREIRRLEQEAAQAEAHGDTLNAIRARRKMYNAQVELWQLLSPELEAGE